MSDRLQLIIIISILAAFPGATGCFAFSPETTQTQSPKIEMQPNNLITLSGVVLHKQAIKNAETWMAGGSDYYVLDVGNIQIQERSATEGVILRSPPTLKSDRFAEYVGKRVEVQGFYIAAQPYVPQNPLESYPTDMNGKPLPRGAGFEVSTIKLLSDKN